MKQYPPLLLKYLKQFQEDPTSKVFAPLAECYRKIGLIEQAIEICNEGLTANPDFTGGKVALARALYDKKMYLEVRDILLPIIDQIPDNLIAQRLLADTSLMLGHFKDALNANRMILYFNPNDKESYEIINELESEMVEKGGGLLKIKRPEKVSRLIKLQRLLTQVQKIQGIRI